MWLLIPLGLFLALAWFGSQVRRGRIKSGPWFKQFRAFRGGVGFLLIILGASLMGRGFLPGGVACFIAGIVLTGTIRFPDRSASGPRGPETAAAYTADEIRAYQTLGVSIGADKKAVKDAWKREMKAAHPDQGGDAKRASALNAARDVLLKRR
jgi:hypothetical protein